MSADIVFLVPGFLGFERAGNFGNFADRVCSALRTQLEGRLKTSVPVVPLASLPTTTYAERQEALLEMMARYGGADTGIKRIHLLGHSVGGVDAYLLSCLEPVGGLAWTEIDPRWLRSKVRSVITIGAPHAGTCLATAPGADAGSLGGLVVDPVGLRATLDLVNRLLRSAMQDARAAGGALALRREYRKVKHFMAELLRWQAFLPALTPDAMESLYARSEPRDDVLRRSFVTMAADPRDVDAPGSHASRADGFFEELSRRTSGSGNGFTRHSPGVRDAIVNLRAALEDPARMIAANGARVPQHVDAQTNDGMVNAARQLMDPSAQDELAAVVIGDHFDVLGYYDRGQGVAGATGDDAGLSGLLHSGSVFRDTEFFSLYRRVGDLIAHECIETRSEVPQAEPSAQPKKPARRTPSRRPSA
jgi:pimeloyl-ACP methyl ester carboxylesterase